MHAIYEVWISDNSSYTLTLNLKQYTRVLQIYATAFPAWTEKKTH